MFKGYLSENRSLKLLALLLAIALWGIAHYSLMN